MARTRRPRYRNDRRHSRRFAEFLTAMETKWSGEEAEIAVSVVGTDELDLASTPNSHGPWTLRGAPPPELRFARFWIAVGASDIVDVYQSREDLAQQRSLTAIASWDLSPDFVSTATPLAISAVTNGADTLTRSAHGFAVGDGPFYVASDGAVPGGLAALTPYWIQAIPTANTFTLASSLGGDLLDITNDGSGTITLVPLGIDISAAFESIRITAHGMQTGDGPVRVSTAGVLPVGLAAATDYWVIRHDANRFALAANRAAALAGTKVNLTGIGSGTHQLVRALTIGKDLSAAGLVEWMAQGIPKVRIETVDVEDVDTLFV